STMKQEAAELFELSCSSFDELEKRLRKSLKTTARFGPRKNLLRIGKHGGFMSMCCMLRPDWRDCSKEERARLPGKILFKFSYSDHLEAVAMQFIGCRLNEEVRNEALRKTNNCEGLFYSLLSSSTADSLPVPGPLCFKPIRDDRDVGFVMMDYVKGTSSECHEPNSLAEVEQIISSIARLQVISVRERLDQVKNFNWNPWRTIGTCVLTKKVSRKVITEIPGFYGSEFEPLTSKLLANLDEYYDPEAPMRELKEIKPVLVHGDIWQSNIIWSYGRDRPRQLKAIIDWQSVHVGSPAADIVFLLVSVLDGEERRTHWRSLLGLLYQSIEREMAPTKPSFSFDDLLASYNRLFPILGLIALMRFSVLFKCSLAPASPEDRIKFTGRMTKRLYCLTEDVVEALEKSRKSG
ncbi:hypothetical protein PMAYCL1PPCAC_00799, partial [Pristionchus mayeri]